MDTADAAGWLKERYARRSRVPQHYEKPKTKSAAAIVGGIIRRRLWPDRQKDVEEAAREVERSQTKRRVKRRRKD